VGFVGVGLEGYDHGVEAAGDEEFVVHFVEEIIRPIQHNYILVKVILLGLRKGRGGTVFFSAPPWKLLRQLG
jgi:hypothetical protein